MSTPSRMFHRLIAAGTFALALPMVAAAQPHYEGLGPLASDRSGASLDRSATAPDRPGEMPHGHHHGGRTHAHAHHGSSGHGRMHHGHPYQGPHHGHMGHMDRFQGAGADVAFGPGQGRGAAFLRGLRLDETQRDRVFEIVHAQAPALRAQVKALRTARMQLHETSLSGNYDQARAQSLAQAVGQAHAEIARLRAGSMQAIYQVLTPEQRRQIEQRRAQPGDGPMRSAPR